MQMQRDPKRAHESEDWMKMSVERAHEHGLVALAISTWFKSCNIRSFLLASMYKEGVIAKPLDWRLRIWIVV